MVFTGEALNVAVGALNVTGDLVSLAGCKNAFRNSCRSSTPSRFKSHLSNKLPILPSSKAGGTCAGTADEGRPLLAAVDGLRLATSASTCTKAYIQPGACSTVTWIWLSASCSFVLMSSRSNSCTTANTCSLAMFHSCSFCAISARQSASSLANLCTIKSFCTTPARWSEREEDASDNSHLVASNRISFAANLHAAHIIHRHSCSVLSTARHKLIVLVRFGH